MLLNTIAIACAMAMTLTAASATTNMDTSDTDDRWLVYEGDASVAPGRGRRIVFMSGDEEYRSEEGLPMLARGLAKHGFETVVLLCQNPETGEVDPEQLHHIPGTHLIEDADVLVLQLRFREFPDGDMDRIMDHVNKGKPLVAIRTTTHPFFYRKATHSPHAKWSWNADNGGFGKQIVGETWVNHHGHHGKEATRGIPHDANKDHPVLRGVKDVFGPTDVYGIRSLPSDATVLLDGGIVAGMKPSDPLVEDTRNSPMHPVGWLRERPVTSEDREHDVQKIVVTTMGTAEDFSSDDLRTFLANGILWLLGEEIPEDGIDVEIVGRWDPTPFGFGTHRRGVKVKDIRDGWPQRTSDK
ncbi:MAG: ThuA domain-containing protein [Phycisphaerales bacterium]|nr:ThuA domain-containing protein [Phycisphaerales bacterium]